MTRRLCRGCEQHIPEARPNSARFCSLSCGRRYRNREYYNRHPDRIKTRRRNLKENSPFRKHCYGIKNRASKLGVPYNLTPEHLESIWTGICPILEIELSFYTGYGTGHRPNMACVDRIVPSEGYIIGNVQWLSGRANLMKNDASVDELLAFSRWIRRNYE